MINTISICSVFLILLTITPNLVFGATWYDSDWTYAKKITIDSSQVDATLTDFPVLVNMTDTDISASAQSDCDDIIFTDDTNSTKYPHEIENCDLTANDWFTAWVNIPSISSSADTDFFIYYGNSTVSAQENVTGTWNSNYEFVLHLHDDFLDSTGNQDGTNQGTSSAVSQIANGTFFDGINDYIDFSTFVPDADTISFWVQIPDGSNGVIINAASSDAFFNTGTWDWSAYSFGGTLHFTPNTGTTNEITDSDSSTDWRYYVMVRNDGGNFHVYKNGALFDTVATSLEVNDILRMNKAATLFKDLTLDEVKISSVPHSAEWIDAEYNNQITGSTFLSFGDEGTEGGGGGTAHTQDISDGFELGDNTSTNLIMSITQDISDGFELGDSVTTDATFVRDVEDGIEADDTVTSLGIFIEELVDGLILGEHISTDLMAINNVTISDGFVIGDSVTTLGTFIENISDGLELGDETNSDIMIAYTQNVTDGFILGDNATADIMIAYTQNVTDGFELGDNATSNLMISYAQDISDGFVIGDSVTVSKISVFTQNITDGVEIGDSVSTEHMTSNTVNLSDGLRLGDTVMAELDCLTFCTVNIIDNISINDIDSYEHFRPILTALKFSVAPPTDTRLGGVFSNICDYMNNYTMIGIYNNGSIICAKMSWWN